MLGKGRAVQRKRVCQCFFHFGKLIDEEEKKEDLVKRERERERSTNAKTLARKILSKLQQKKKENKTE